MRIITKQCPQIQPLKFNEQKGNDKVSELSTSIIISEENKEIPITIDYEKYKEIQTLSGDERQNILNNIIPISNTDDLGSIKREMQNWYT